jgi:betaine-aldehyde dehydrogenase
MSNQACLPKNTGLFFNGKFHKGDELLISRNPATGEDILEVGGASAETVDKVVGHASRAQPAWWKLDIRERVACVRKFIKEVETHADELATLDAIDSGNPYNGMQIDIKISLAVMDLFAGLATEIKGESFPGSGDRINFSVREPLGVVARIIPFNHPLMFGCIKSVAPLIAGNAVIIKPSEHTPLSALRIAELAGNLFPPGIFNVLNGGRETGSALSQHPKVRNVSLVGSVPTGKAVLADASMAIKSVLLELGGKNPLIVCPDTDVDFAVATAVKGMNLTWTAGQSCGSTSRLLVHESLYNNVVDGVTDAFSRLQLGIPSDKQTEMGCLTTGPQFKKVTEYIEIGVAEGARMTTGGLPSQSPHPEGYFVRPTVFSDVDPGMRIANEEIFGPVLSVIPWKTDDQVLKIANSVDYGLTAGILSNDINQALRMSREVQAGYVWINNSSDHYPGVPFGGYKDSGLGREECLEELLAYTQVKAINIHLR